MVNFQQQVTQSMILSYPDGKQSIAIGPGDAIDFYADDANNTQVGYMTGEQAVWGNTTMPQVAVNTPAINGLGYSTVEFPSNLTAETESAGILAKVYGTGGAAYVQSTFAGPVTNSTDSWELAVTSKSADGTSSKAELAIAYVPTPNATPQTYLQFLPGSISANNPITIDSWHTLALAGLWVADATGSQTPAVMLSNDGWVYLIGWIKNGTIADGTIIATVASPHIPHGNVLHRAPVPFNNTASCTLQMDNAGNLKVFGLGFGNIALDGMKWPSASYL